LLLLPFGASAQSDDQELYDHQLDEDKWEKLRDDIRYEGREEGDGRQWTYESDQEWRSDSRQNEGTGGTGGGTGSGTGSEYGSGNDRSVQPPPPDYDEPPPPPQTSSPNLGGIGALGYILIGLLVVGLMFLIYYMFLNSNSKGKKVTEVAEIEDVNPTEIPLSELQRLLQEALSRKDYRAAVRIYFIFIIRDLAEKKWIAWEKEKTNFHYLREMTGKTEYDDFNRSVSFFEFIWYGQREIDEPTFEKVRPNFTQFLNKLGVE
jgi:hypothetical protein